jgi:uncharacterized protein (TIGR03083 family)
MPTLVDKDSTVDLLRQEYGSIHGVCSALSADQWDVQTCLPGWTVRDVLSHIIGAEAMLSGEESPIVDVSHLDHMQNPIAEANEVWVEFMRSLTGAEMLARFDDVTTRRLAALDAMDQVDFDAPSWTPAGHNETYGRFMRIRHYDCFMHENDIRLAVGVPPKETVGDLDSAVGEVATGLGYIVGRRAGMPDGSRVRIDLTGPIARTYLIAVDGRAAVVDSFDQASTVGLEMPATLFLRLTGGRDDHSFRTAEKIGFSGDRALGEQLVAKLAFTI